MVLDVQGASTTPGTAVIIHGRQSPPANNQLWLFTVTGSGTAFCPYLEVDSHLDTGSATSKLSLEVKDGSATVGAEIVTGTVNPPTTEDKQLWYQVGQQIVPKLNNALALGYRSSDNHAVLVSRSDVVSLWDLEYQLQ